MVREWMTAAWLRLRALFRRRQLDRDLEDELAFHLAMKAERVGSEPAARRRFGNVAGIRETCRELWSLGRIEILWQDFRYSLRLLRRSPVFTIVAVASLALGIGANTLIFSLINTVLLKSLPVRDPHELRVVLWSATKASFENYSGAGTRPQPSGLRTGGSFSYPIYREFRDRAAGFSDLFAFAGVHEASVVHRGEAFTATGLAVSGNFCRGFGVRALLGRTLTPEDDRAGAPPVAVVTHSYWERRAAFDPGILGQNIMLNGSGYTVVGVLPPKVYGPVPGAETDFLVPLSAQPRILPRFPLESQKHWWLQVMGRLEPGADERQARASLEVLFPPLLKASAQRIEQAGIVLEDGRSGAVTGYKIQFRRPLLFLLGAVGLVLLIACANLASLLLARGAARRRELALRTAIGAGRFRLVRQLLVESLLLSLAGAGLGLALGASARTVLLSQVLPAGATARFDTATDARVLAFTLALALITALLFGLGPAFRAARVDPVCGLRDDSARTAPRLRLGKGLVSAQVALSLLLLAGAGLMLRTLVNIWSVEPGFQTEGLLLFRLNAATAGYKERQLVDFYERVRQRAAAIPGVTAVTLSDVRLVSGSVSTWGFTVPGRVLKPGEHLQANTLFVGDAFLATMGIPLLLGRDLAASDNADAPQAAVVNEAFARTIFPSEVPLGKTFRVGKSDIQIVGVCRDAKYSQLTRATEPTMYRPYRQKSGQLGAMHFEVRTATPPLSVASAVRRAVTVLDRNVPLTDFKTQEAQIEESIAPQRLLTILCGSFAALAVLLSAVGLYGVMAYTVARRRAEIGIRLALGADRGSVLRMILREALLLVAAGVAVGLPAALALTRLVERALFGVKPQDPATFAGAVLLLLAVAAAAAWVPARRASRLEPVTLLRCE